MKNSFGPIALLVLSGGVLPIACNALTGIDHYSVDPAWSSSSAGGQAGAGGDAGAGGSAGAGGMGGGAPGCITVLTCPGETNACQTRACVAGACQLVLEPEGKLVPGQVAGDCMRKECDGFGKERMVVDTKDVPEDGLECTQDGCMLDGMPVHTPAAQGSGCNQNSGKICNGTGQCVQCNFGPDCSGGGLCVNGTCIPPECNDQIKNGNESDIDCGGMQCAPCAVDQGCLSKFDCASKVCTAGVCKAPTCLDNEANGEETDVDCGGPTCGDCADGKACLVASDCISGVCTGGFCQAPKCNDGVKNGNETDVDCGANCPGCALGHPCNKSLDCSSEVCRNGTCTSVVQVDVGTGHACALLGDGTVFCWGANGVGQLGDGTTNPHLAPFMVPGLSNVTQISTSAHITNQAVNGHTCARTNEGKLYCWGSNSNGQVGDGTKTDVSSPKLILNADVVQVAAGRLHTCVRLTSGEVNCWGNNGSGQLGTGNTTGTTAPGAPLAGLNAKSITAGVNHTCAILATGELSCWGANPQGQLGIGTTMNALVPTLVPGSANVIAVDTGYAFTCGADMGGVLRCFGINTNGELGIGTMTQQTSPQVVTTLTNVIGVTTGTHINPGGHACAVRSNGGASCWGTNSTGQLGVGDTNNRLTPVPVSLPPVAEIAAGFQFTCARLVSGPIRCWGRNELSQLGTGKATTMEMVPVPVVFP